MPRIRALQIHPVMEGVEVWKIDTAIVPLERALMREFVGIGVPLEKIGRASCRERVFVCV